jgi:ATP-dependent protease HslVU (ClpYQ) peptidase subunit
VLAADKQATQSDMRRTVTKIRKLRGHLCAVAGDWDYAQDLFTWFEDGADARILPAFQKTDQNWVAFLVITPDKRVLKYERSAYPMDYTESVKKDGWYVFGSGRDYAVGALAMGATATEAVKIASKYCISCGCGVTSLTL